MVEFGIIFVYTFLSYLAGVIVGHKLTRRHNGRY